MTKTKSVQVKDLEKIYPGQDGKQIVAVNKVSINIKPGEFITLLGPSGCGKTTILRMIAGFEIPTGGSIFIGEDNIDKLPPDKRDTAGRRDAPGCYIDLLPPDAHFHARPRPFRVGPGLVRGGHDGQPRHRPGHTPRGGQPLRGLQCGGYLHG